MTKRAASAAADDAKRVRVDAPVSPAAPSGRDHVAPACLPRNTQLPSGPLSIDACAPGCTRIAIWNITSLKSSDNKGLMRYLHAENADVIVLSETKVNQVPSHAGLDAMYKYRYWGIGEKKGYAGIAVLSKRKPVHVDYGLPGFDDPSSQARMLTVEFPHTVLVGTYAVNAGDGLKTLPNKNRWNDALEQHLLSLQSKNKDVIWCGDLNVVWDDRDLAGASKSGTRRLGTRRQSAMRTAACSHRRTCATHGASGIPTPSDTIPTMDGAASAGAAALAGASIPSLFHSSRSTASSAARSGTRSTAPAIICPWYVYMTSDDR